MNDRRRQQLRDRLSARTSSAPSSHGKPAAPTWLDLLNSKFVVTIVGGLLVWFVSAAWQFTESERRLEREQALREYEIRLEILREFSSDFPFTLRLARDFKAREAWIARNRGDVDAIHLDGRSYHQSVLRFETLSDAYFQRTSAYAFAARMRASYAGTRVEELAEALVASMDKLIGAGGPNSREIVRRQRMEMEEIFQELVFEMGNALEEEDASR